MRERDVEKYLKREIAKVGGECFKWTSPGRKGVPDQLVFLPSGAILMVEVKAPGKRPTALQADFAKTMAVRFGRHVYTVDSYAAVDAFVSYNV